MRSNPASSKWKHRRRAAKFALLRHVAVPACLWLFKLWARTWRYEWRPVETFNAIARLERPVSLATLHGQLALLLGMAQRRPGGLPFRSATMISPSRDGQLLGDVIRAFGQDTVVGSSKKRGAAGLLELRRRMREGRMGCLAIDGPRGPRAVPQPGILTLATATKSRLYILLAHPRHAIRFPSWDRFVLPLPFTRVIMLVEEFRDYAQTPPDKDERALLQHRMLELLEQMGEDTSGVHRLELEDE